MYVCKIFIKNQTNLYCIFTYIFICVCGCLWGGFSSWYQITGVLNTHNNCVVLLILFCLNIKKVPAIKQIFFFFVCLFDKNQQYNHVIDFFINTGGSINFNLVNGIMLIHPILLYILYASVTSNIFVQLYVYKKKLMKNYVRGGFLNKPILLFVLLTFFLGCYWAEQELF